MQLHRSEIVTTTDAVLAVTGAPVDVFVNGEQVAQYERIALDVGDGLRFGVIRGGAKYFIAVHGGIDVPLVLGSRSTYLPGAIGGVGGRALIKGDLVAVGKGADNGVPVVQSISAGDRPAFSKESTFEF